MLKIFIADDSEIVRDRLNELLTEMDGFDIVGWAGDAAQAILEIRRLKPDFVILDIRMPGGDGLAILKDIKTTQPGCDVAILTSYPEQQYRQAYLMAGADYFFDKTKDIPNLTRALVALADNHRK